MGGKKKQAQSSGKEVVGSGFDQTRSQGNAKLDIQTVRVFQHICPAKKISLKVFEHRAEKMVNNSLPANWFFMQLILVCSLQNTVI